MKRKSKDNTRLGFIIGLIGPWIGFCIYGVFWAYRFNKTFTYFATDVFLGVPSFRSSILAICLLFNLIPFLFFIRTDRNLSARGVLAAVFLYAPIVIYFYFS